MDGIFRVSDIATLMRHASMSASYKPALLKALVRICRVSDSLSLPLERIGEEFARMYWNQTVLYHLRQASSLTKESEVIKLIRRTADEHRVRYFSDLPEAGKARIRKRMARVLTINVLAAFHTSKPLGMPPLYTWNKGENAVALSGDSLAFLRAHGAVLEIVANYHWAAFLESCNRLAPHIILKVERDGVMRRSLAKFLRVLMEEDDAATCFYCERHFSAALAATVDHVIPWSFLLEDPLWDLVLACRPCNSSKSDALPESAFIDRLVARNAELTRNPLKTNASAFVDGSELYRLYEAAISVEWPGFWTPAFPAVS